MRMGAKPAVSAYCAVMKFLLKETGSGVNDIVYQHEVIVPGLRLSCFSLRAAAENTSGKHWHRSIEIFVVRQGSLIFPE